MRLKEGVCITGIRPELIIGLMAAEAAYRAVGVGMVVTSITDGKHSLTSLHYAGAAADLRTRDMTESQIASVLRAIAKALPNDFDIIFEGNHYHLEYDPRRPHQ